MNLQMTTEATSQAMVRTSRSAWSGAVRAEILKLWSLLSNRVLLTVSLVMVVGSSGMLSLAMISRLTDERFAGQRIAATPIMFIDSVLWVQIVIAIVAVLATANEYTSGQVRLSLLSLPTRSPWLGAKAMVLGCAGFFVGLIGSAAALGLSAVILSGTEVHYEIGFSEAALLSLKSGLYLAMIAIFVTGVTAFIRHAVVALCTVLAVLIVVPPVLSSVPGISGAADILPTIAGRRLISDFESALQLDQWAGFGVLTTWAIAALVLSLVALKARDA